MKPSLKLLLFSLAFFSISAAAQIRLPGIISDGLVLQRDENIRIWGWSSAQEKITLTFHSKVYRTRADEDGNWEITLPPQSAGGPHELNLKGKNEIILTDVLIGDVWLCAGQSNMVLPMERVKEKYPADIAGANYPEIRNFFIRTTTDLQEPRKDLPSGSWKSATPQDVLAFGAASYFFAREIYEKYHVPIGLINASVGGTPIEAWISEEGLKAFPDLLETVGRNKDTAYINHLVRQARANRIVRKEEDRGMLEAIQWFDPDYVPKGWENIHIPGYWEDQGLRDLDGVVWYRKEIEVPASMTEVPAKIFMGRIVDADRIYVNGVEVGNITYQYPPRRYNVEAGILKPGVNTIVIRVTNTGGKGGFVPDKPYFLTANEEVIDLKGDWMYKVGEAFIPVSGPRGGISFQNQPTSLYNAMAAPLRNLGVKGFLWYQGESNAGNPAPYYDLLPALIKDWRSQWKNNNLPFLYVQLANFMERDFLPVESSWAELRDAQLKALSMPNTAMAVAIDLGEWNDIHPLNKKEVGHRLALGARHLAYGETELVYSGPIYRAHQVEGNKMVIAFDHVGSGLISVDGEPLSQFAVAGANGKFVWADAEIVNGTVVVSHASVSKPEYVRYAWSDNPAGANLYNKEGLPASPFQVAPEKGNDDLIWMGKKAAVVLTYDDALNEHLDHAIPALDSLGFRGSFYIPGASKVFQERLTDWSMVANKGHELGNHTLYHPCDASKPGRNWVPPANDLSQYSLDQITKEIRMASVFLERIDGKDERTFAYTCGDMTVKDNTSFTDVIRNDFVAARGVRGRLNTLENVNLSNVDCFVVNGETGEQLIAWVEEAARTNSMLTILFHGVGGGHSLDVSLDAHSQLLHYLKDHEDEIWVDTLLEVAKHVKKHQSK